LEEMNGKRPKFTLPLRLPNFFDECTEILLPTMITLHVLAIPLKRLPPNKLWSKGLNMMWAVTDFPSKGIMIMKLALDGWEANKGDKSALDLLHAAIGLFALPSHAIVTASNLAPVNRDIIVTMPDETTFDIKVGKGEQPSKVNLQGPPPHPDPPGRENGARRSAVVAATHMHNERQRKATQQLFSNGVAKGSMATATLLRKAHPQHDAALVLPVPHGPQELVTSDTALKLLVKKAGSKESSIGFFGWAGDYLFRSLVDEVNAPNAFLTQTARFTALMASGDAPEALAFLATAGSINALNKLPAKENDALIAAGKDPKIRPINSRCTFGKYAVKLLTETLRAG
jgi:hypothetical protein